MKKFLFLRLFPIFLLYVSCESTTLDKQEESEPVYAVEAVSESVKTALGDDKVSVNWVEGDKIAVNGKKSNALTSASIKGSNATFTFTENIAPGPYDAFYPVNDNFSYNNSVAEFYLANSDNCETGNFDPARSLLAVREDSKTLTFEHKMAYLKLALDGYSEVKEINISGRNANDVISGWFQYDFSTSELSPNGSKENLNNVRIFFNPAISLREKEVYVAIPAIKYQDGLQVKVHSANSVLCSKKKSQSLDAQPGYIYDIAFDYDAQTPIIDGDISDWDKLHTQDITCRTTAPDNRYMKIRLCSDSQYVYMLYEVAGNNIYGNLVSDIFIDTDDNYNTGGSGNGSGFDNTGIDWFIEQNLVLADNVYSDGTGHGLYKYTATQQGLNFDVENRTHYSNSGNYMNWKVISGYPKDGKIIFEARFSRAEFNMKKQSIRIGFKAMDWGNQNFGTGFAPYITKNGDMATIQLCTYK